MSAHSPVRLLVALVSCAVMISALPAPSEAEVIDRIVAKINREIITLHELKRASGPYLFAFGIDPQTIDERDDSEKIYRQVLEDMINTRLMLQEARSLQLEVTDDDVSRWVANIHAQMSLTEDQFRTSLRAKGIRWADYRRYVHDNLIKVRVIQVRISSRIKITEEEVEKVYREDYGTDPDKGLKEVDVSHVFIPIPEGGDDGAMARVKALVDSTLRRVKEPGTDFAAVAKEVSAGPTAADGGYLGSYKPGDLGKDIDPVVFNTAEGQVTDPIRVENGFHIFKIHKVGFTRDPAIEEKLAQLRGQLREEQLNKELDTWINNLRQRAFVRIIF